MLPGSPLPPTSPVKLSMSLFEEVESEVIPTFALLMNFLLLRSQKRPTTRASSRSAEPSCKALFKLRGESAVD